MDSEELFLLQQKDTNNLFTLGNNFIINGAMEIFQRNVGVTGGGAFVSPANTTAATAATAYTITGSSSTVTVDTTLGVIPTYFPASGTFVLQANSPDYGITNTVVTYTGTTATTFTGCTAVTSAPGYAIAAGQNNVIISSFPYALDRWAVMYPGRVTPDVAGKITTTQSTNAPAGLTYSLQATVATTAFVGQYSITQPLELGTVDSLGYGSSGAQTTTLSFWVNSSVTGTYYASVRNYPNTARLPQLGVPTRSYVAKYSIPVANTWTKISLVIPGDTSTTGWTTPTAAQLNATFLNSTINSQTMPYTSGAMYVSFDIGSDSSVQCATSTVGTWQSGNFTAAADQTQFMSNSGATFNITGVQLSTGATTPSVFSRSAGTIRGELSACQRYYYRIDGTAVTGNVRLGQGEGSGTSATNGVAYPTTMRITPTTTISQVVGNFASYNIINGYVSHTVMNSLRESLYFNRIGGALASSITTNATDLARATTTASPCWIEFVAEL